jgi:hypothetical protein
LWKASAFGPAELLQQFPERCDAQLHCRIVLDARNEYADTPHLVALLRARRAATPPPCRREGW